MKALRKKAERPSLGVMLKFIIIMLLASVTVMAGTMGFFVSFFYLIIMAVE